MKNLDVCGIGNAIVDLIVEVDEALFTRLGFERGTMRLVDVAEQKVLLEALPQGKVTLSSGGSVANSIIALAQLGGKGGFIGCVGDDRYGLFYKEEFQNLGIDIGNPIIVGEPTATSAIVVTPDAERTMRTCLAVSAGLSAKHVDPERIKRSQWLFIEGYLFANPENGQSAVFEAIEIARRYETKIAITCSEAFVVQAFGDALNKALMQASMLFANETEASALAELKEPDARKAFEKLHKRFSSLVVSAGAQGAYVGHAGIETHVQAFPCNPKDLTGAGDMVAGAFLYGMTQKISAPVAARAACYLASKVISQVGARLTHGTKQHWDEVIKEEI